jgi:hypothetical protein
MEKDLISQIPKPHGNGETTIVPIRQLHLVNVEIIFIVSDTSSF